MISSCFPYAYNLKYVSYTICTLIIYISNVIESLFQWLEAGVSPQITYVREDVNILRQYDPSAVTGSRLTLIGCNPLADSICVPLVTGADSETDQVYNKQYAKK